MTTFVFSFSLGVYLFNNFGISEGSCATRIPAASKDSIFSFAEPELPEMIAPACPICFPGTADNGGRGNTGIKAEAGANPHDGKADRSDRTP